MSRFHFTDYDTSAECGESNNTLARLVYDWEAASKLPNGHKTKVINARFGVVLSEKSKFYKRLYWQYFFQVGPLFAPRDALFHWIHLEDVCHALDYLTHLNGLDESRISPAYFLRITQKDQLSIVLDLRAKF